MKNFQLILLIVFIAAAAFGLLVFSGMIPLGSNKDSAGGGGTVILWGTISQQAIFVPLDDFNHANPRFIVQYVQKDPVTFDQDLLEALASGVGPDLFFLPDNLIFHYSKRISTIPYQSFPLASFKSTFAGAGEVFLTSKGILALPLFIDPLVMYYNRSILDSNNIVNPPVTWDELQNLAPILTKKDQNKKIIKSTVALGQFSNVTHAKDIISTLFMQAGNPIINEKEGSFFSALRDGSIDLGSILKFYTDFSDPVNGVYSWNKSLPESINLFSSEDLAFYFGYASELSSLINRNPNENFSVAPIPQLKNSNIKMTFGRTTGVAMSSFSKNPTGAFSVMGLLTTGDFAKELSVALNTVPARRDLLAVKNTDAYFPIFYSSALIARSWLDPSPKDTDDIFRGMVEKVLSNNLAPSNSVNDASAKLGLLLAK